METHSDDPKKLWNVMKSIYGESNKSALKCEKFSDTIETDPQVVSDKLNQYFIHSIVSLQGSMPIVDKHLTFMLTSTCEIFSFEKLTYEMVNMYCQQIKSKYYHDNMTGKLINDAVASSALLLSLTNLINSSLMSGVVPESFKCSTITSVQKVQNSNNASNLRPINMLSVLGQLLERVVKDQLVNHFESNKIFASEQSGFRRNHSCETAISYVLPERKDALNSNSIVVSVFLDLKRAFETINRELLIEKLRLYRCDE